MKNLNRDDLFEIIDKKKMKKLYGLESDGLLVKKGGYLFPKLICQELINHPNIKIYYNHCFKSWVKNKSKLDIHFFKSRNKI